MLSCYKLTHLHTSVDDDLVSAGWPWKGSIVFKNIQMRYQPELPTVLCNMNLRVNPGESVGIVGRTGSGKSSVFRG